MRKPNLRKSCPIWVTILAILAVAGIVAATIMFTYNITNTITVYADYTLEVRKDSQSGPLVTALNWGLFNSSSDTVQQELFIINTGNIEAYFSWTTDTFPAEFSISGEVWNFETSSWDSWNEGALYSEAIQPGIGSYRKVRITLTLNSVIPGNYGFDLNFNANNT